MRLINTCFITIDNKCELLKTIFEINYDTEYYKPLNALVKGGGTMNGYKWQGRHRNSYVDRARKYSWRRMDPAPKDVAVIGIK